MSEPSGRGYKTLAIRLSDGLHAQLVLIAGLEGTSLTDAIRTAIEELIERRRADGQLAAQAAKALEEMDQEAASRRQALQALLESTWAVAPTASQQAPAKSAPATPSQGRSRRSGSSR